MQAGQEVPSLEARAAPSTKAKATTLTEYLGMQLGKMLTAVGAKNGEEGAALNFLPQVKPSRVPVLSRVGKVVLDNGPDNILSRGGVAIVEQPPGITDEGNSSKGRTVSLRPSPVTGELRQVDHELGLSKSSATREITRGVRDALDLGLGHNVVLNLSLKCRVVAVSKRLNDAPEDQGTVSSPGVPVCFVSILDLRFPAGGIVPYSLGCS